MDSKYDIYLLRTCYAVITLFCLICSISWFPSFSLRQAILVERQQHIADAIDDIKHMMLEKRIDEKKLDQEVREEITSALEESQVLLG